MANFAQPPRQPIYTNQTRMFSDLNISFNAVPVTEDVAVNVGNPSVIASVVNLVMTGYYERPFQPMLGSSTRQLLFENMTPLTATLLQTSIIEVLKNYEPRVSVQSVVVTPDPDNNNYIATITFLIINNVAPTTITVFLERLR